MSNYNDKNILQYSTVKCYKLSKIRKRFQRSTIVNQLEQHSRESV